MAKPFSHKIRMARMPSYLNFVNLIICNDTLAKASHYEKQHSQHLA